MPKTPILLIFVFILSLVSCKKKEELHFFKGTFAEAHALAKQQNKLLFVEGFADWCHFCKQMESETFKDEDVIAFFNEKFVNYQFDAEKGDGIELAQKYDVNIFPYLMFINNEGKIVYLTTGFANPQAFIEKGKKALEFQYH